MRTEIRFKIDALKPETLSIGRLVAYLTELDKLFGDEAGLHLECIVDGSAELVGWVDEQARPVIERRLRLVGAGDGPADAVKALGSLNELLRQDNSIGGLKLDGAVIIPFPGRNLPIAEVVGPVQQPTTIEGQLIRIGGKDKTVHFHLADVGRTWSGEITRQLAKDMGRYLFGPTLRVRGAGVWKRAGQGPWILSRFQASNFDVLNDATLLEAMAKLRRIEPDRGGVTEPWQGLRGDDDAE